MEITNAAGDKFVGKLNNGAPDEGTMVLPPQGIPKRENGKTDYPLVNTRFSSVPKNEHETQLLRRLWHNNE